MEALYLLLFLLLFLLLSTHYNSDLSLFVTGEGTKGKKKENSSGWINHNWHNFETMCTH